jgi:glycosyltransferase involved in cell wall biosynthesis
MARGFAAAGYEVFEIVGYARERKRRFEQLRRELDKGRSFDFVYSESSTMPLPLADQHHLPLHPWFDYAAMRSLRARGTKVGLFYRDIHWAFEQYKTSTRFHKRAVATAFYHFDWWQYRRSVDHLFLPSMRMAAHLPTPWPEQQLSTLPPGVANERLAAGTLAPRQPGERLALLYVGGVTPPVYDLRRLLAAVARLPATQLTLCCREEEWKRQHHIYAHLLNERVSIVHLSAEALAPLYAEADLFCMAWAPDEYMSFAMPVKMFECLGYGLPIITTPGTAAAEFIAANEIGWVADDAGEAGIAALLDRLAAQPEAVAARRSRTDAVRRRNSWADRARAVATALKP